MKLIILGTIGLGVASSSAGITYSSESRSIFGDVLVGDLVLIDGEFVNVYDDYGYGAVPLADFDVSGSLSGLFSTYASSNQTSSLSASGGSYRGGVSANEAFSNSIFSVGFSVTSNTLFELSGSAASYYDGGVSILLMNGGDNSTVWELNPADWVYDSLSGATSQDFAMTQELEAAETYFLSVYHFNGGFGQVASAANFTFSIPEPSSSLLVMASCCFLGIRRR